MRRRTGATECHLGKESKALGRGGEEMSRVDSFPSRACDTDDRFRIKPRQNVDPVHLNRSQKPWNEFS